MCKCLMFLGVALLAVGGIAGYFIYQSQIATDVADRATETLSELGAFVYF